VRSRLRGCFTAQQAPALRELLKSSENFMSKQFDVIVIGGGPVATLPPSARPSWASAWRASMSGRTTKAARRPAGPAPTWAAFRPRPCCSRREHFDHANHHFAEHGIEVKGVSMDVAKMLGRKNTVVKQNNDGILYLFKKNKVAFFHGRGSFVKAADGGYEIKVAGAAEETIIGKQIIVATGSNAPRVARYAF